MLYSGSIDCFRKVLRTEGLRGVYSGLPINALASGAAWGAYFYCYSYFKKRYYVDGADERKLAYSENLLCATQAGIVVATLTNPLWLIKTRMILPPPVGRQPYKSFARKSRFSLYSILLSHDDKKKKKLDAFVDIIRTEGVIRGPTRGLGTALLGVSQGAVQFMVYEELKQVLKSQQIENDATIFAAAATSKIVSVTITYPYQVIRTRMQVSY